MFARSSAMFLLAASFTGVIAFSNAATPPLSDFDTVQWPLERVGTKQTTLQVPSAYGAGSPRSREFSAAVEKKHRKFSDNAYRLLLISAMWPDLRPSDGHEFDEHRDPNAMATTVSSGAVDREGSQQSDELQGSFRQEIYTAGIPLCFGNDHPRTCYQRNTPDVKSSQYGLERVGVDFSKYPAFPEADRTSLETQDVYFLREPTGVVSTLILCTAEEAKTAPDGPAFRGPAHCEHKFISKKLNALISITYSRPLLKYWSEIQARWLSLIDSFAPGEEARHQIPNR